MGVSFSQGSNVLLYAVTIYNVVALSVRAVLPAEVCGCVCVGALHLLCLFMSCPALLNPVSPHSGLHVLYALLRRWWPTGSARWMPSRTPV